MAVAVLVPFTFTMEPAPALVLLGAIYTGAIYGGAYSAVLLNTPGTPSAIATTFDGFPMAKRGDGDLAITLACLASVVGGLVGALFLLLLAPPLADFALAFGPIEYFWLAILGLTLIAALSEGDSLKGMVGACVGLMMSMVGSAVVGGDIRYTLDSTTLLGGIGVVPALIGLFCIPVLIDLVASRDEHLELQGKVAGFRLRRSDAHRHCREIQPRAQFDHRHRDRRAARRRRLDRRAGRVFGSTPRVPVAADVWAGESGRHHRQRIVEQRDRGRRLHSDAGARHPGHAGRRRGARRAAGAGRENRTVALQRAGRDRLHVHLRPADRHTADAAGGPGTGPLRVQLDHRRAQGVPGPRDRVPHGHRQLRDPGQCRRRHHHVRHWPRGLGAEPLRLSAGADRARTHPGPARRAGLRAGVDDRFGDRQPGRHVLLPADLARDHGRCGADPAVPGDQPSSRTTPPRHRRRGSAGRRRPAARAADAGGASGRRDGDGA